jgi:voltage-gated potassium channel Kch
VNIIDLLSFLPFYLEILFGVAFLALNMKLNIGIFQVMRLFRIFRLIRIPQAQILVLAISKSLEALAAIFFYALVTILIASTAIYYAERGKYDPNRRLYVLPDGRISQFQNIPICTWWAVVSMTTTGYGDMIPTTVLGKLIGGFSILVGVLVIALPSMIIGRKFGELSSQYKVKQKLDKKKAERERMYRELNEQQLREVQETDLIKSLRKHNRYLNEQKQQMQILMKQTEETQRMIHQILEQIEKRSNNGIYQSD